MEKLDLFTGCLIGGALGDALGYPIEFSRMRDNIRANGIAGITEPLLDNSGYALISDDTQMTLFTANGLLLAANEGLDRNTALWLAYQRWYYTQAGTCFDRSILDRRVGDPLPFILDQQELFAWRAPGTTCLTELYRMRKGAPGRHLNNSKGCGGIMRVAPCGLIYATQPDSAYKVGMKAAALTHGHPTGYIAAGALAMMIALLIRDRISIAAAARIVSERIKDVQHGAETVTAIDKALFYAKKNIPTDRALLALGEGWIAEETLAIALYCAVKADSPRNALILAVNHSGDSDSTGAVCGNLVGACYGIDSFPKDWIDHLELEGFIRATAFELYRHSGIAERRETVYGHLI